MKLVNVTNTTRPLLNQLRIKVCDTFFTRLRGLTFHPPLEIDQGILLIQARESRVDTAIHMFGVSINLGIVWVNATFRVVDLIQARKWWTIHIPKSPARYIIECRPDRLKEFKLGDEINFEELAI